MNRTLLLMGVLAPLACAAQTPRDFPSRKVTAILPHHGSPITYAGDRAIIWSDDFSNASNWMIDDIDDPNNDEWVIGTDEPQGTFSSTYGAIESTTAANGFAMFDSDYLCGGSQQAYVMNATAIDLSGYPGAVLQFEQYFTRFRGDTYVDISADGSNWTEIEVNDEVNVNASTDNPELTSLNISSVAGSSTVYIRFRYYSTVAAHGAGAGCDYAWMVDDVAILELEPYDLQVSYGVISHTGNGEEYGRVPANQLNPQMNFGAQLLNFGANPQTNVTVQVTVTDAGSTTVFDQTFTLNDIAAGATADMDEFVNMPTLTPGIYDVTFIASSAEVGQDALPANNTVVRQFAIDDDVYALDGIDVYDANDLTAIGSTSFEGAADGLEVMTYYEIVDEAVVYGVSAQLANGTEAGSAVIVSLFDTTSVFANNLNSPLAQSDVTNVTAANLASGQVTGLFPGAYTLTPGAYYASVRLLSAGNTSDISILDDNTVPQPGGGSLIYDPSQSQVFSNGNASAVRLELNETVGVPEHGTSTLFTLYPNPTNGILRVNTAETGKLEVQVINALGAVVLNDRFSGNTTLDLTGMASGVYSVRVIKGSSSSVQRVTLD